MVTQVELSKDWNEVERSFKKQERNIRRLRRSEYTYRISKRVEDFEFFYTRMYVPLVRQRHADEAFIDTHKNLLKYFERGFLLQILDRDGNPVAADLDYLNGDMLFGIACGVLDGNPDILEEGALSAIYYYTLKWCHENRIPRCDICEVHPFTQDGVYQYKRRWGYQPVPELWNTREWLLWVPQLSSPAMHWIHEHPFLPEFAKSGSDILFQGMKNRSYLRGLFKQRAG
jgi:predicted N-acyltransferase